MKEKKHKNEFYKMLEKFKYLDFIIGVILIIVVLILKRKYIWPSILGFIISIISFYINSYTVNYSIKNLNSRFLIIFSYIFRVILVSVIGIILFMHNKFDLIAYMFGYTLRLCTFLLYGLFMIKKNKRGV